MNAVVLGESGARVSFSRFASATSNADSLEVTYLGSAQRSGKAFGLGGVASPSARCTTNLNPRGEGRASHKATFAIWIACRAASRFLRGRLGGAGSISFKWFASYSLTRARLLDEQP